MGPCRKYVLFHVRIMCCQEILGWVVCDFHKCLIEIGLECEFGEALLGMFLSCAKEKFEALKVSSISIWCHHMS